jgi:hypothetical protein
MSDELSLFKPTREEKEGDRRFSIGPKALIWCLSLILYATAIYCFGWGWGTLTSLALTIAWATLTKGK